ncbi:hypothetical protein [Actinomadura violacea]|uniref:Uncharacterized protein n=1 Tax=Actinomadura violacea TaxID=2819934 RepID=A0ABS3S8I2_9ACTN|nr:hypothetical protein [Actinomadura violacea]MBO2465315.1 hypothetical protein [Actinomadura violacea]
MTAVRRRESELDAPAPGGGRPARRTGPRSGARAAAVEGGIVLALGAVLSACSLGLLVLQTPVALHFTAGDLAVAFAAGVTAAAVVRANVRLHRRWKRTVGRFTAAAALCAVAALAGTAVAMIPGHCPGSPAGSGHCGVREAAAWGQVAGLAAVVNFGLAGMALGVYRGVRGVVLDASEQGAEGLRALGRLRRRRAGRAGAAPRHPQEPKGRPTPRRADAERARRKRLGSRS